MIYQERRVLLAGSGSIKRKPILGPEKLPRDKAMGETIRRKSKRVVRMLEKDNSKRQRVVRCDPAETGNHKNPTQLKKQLT